MRKFSKTMALLLALALVFTTFGAVTVSAASFSDTQGHWAEGVIDKWSAAGVVNGYSDGTFKPDNNITRAELAKVISTARQYTASADINFSDVSADDWYAADLGKCVAAGVIGGYEDGTFKPDNNVTREEAAAMFQRAYQVNAHGLSTFADSAEISSWAETAVSALVGAGVINGYPEDNTFRPAASITRAEVVKVLDGITNVGTQPGATSIPGQNNVSAGTVVTGGLGGSANTGGGSIGGWNNNNNNNNNGVSITFNANGGTFADGKTTVTITISKNNVIGGAAPDVTYVEELPAPTAGVDPEVITYKFGGWYKSKQAADNLDDTQKWDVNVDKVTSGMTLYAGWYQDGEVFVTFDLNGGNIDGETTMPLQRVMADTCAAEPSEVPVREHYTFLGWYEGNNAASPFDFAGTPIKTNTTIYARWKVDAEYAAAEITMPDTTVGSSANGKIIASPESAIPNEVVSLKVVSPDGYKVRAIKSLSYTSTSGVKKSTANADDNFTATLERGGIVKFVLPGDVVNGTLELDVYFTPGVEEEANVPTPTPAPTATPDPSEEDPDLGPGYQAYKFHYDIFTPYVGGKLPAKTDFNGLSVESDTDLDGSKKSFVGSGRSYTNRLKVGTKKATVKVYGPCDVIIDAVSASSADRSYDVTDDKGNVLVDDFMCLNGESPTCKFRYEGGEGSITIKGNAGINIYGIILFYGEDFAFPTAPPTPTPTVAPTPTPFDPALKHAITAKTDGHGTVVPDVAEASQGDKVTLNIQPEAGYKAVHVYMDPGIPVEAEADGNYSFIMPYSNVSATVRMIPETAEAHVIKAGEPSNGTIKVTPKTSYITQPVMNSSEMFLDAESSGGWAVDSNGATSAEEGLTPTAVEDEDDIRGNSTTKMMVNSGDVLYDIGSAVDGPFTLSYDILTKGGAKQSFRTYLDNAADAVDPATGKAISGGNGNAFFHMTNLNDRIYTAKDPADLEMTAPTRTAFMFGKEEFEDNRWFKVIIKGNTNDDTVAVEYHRHSANGNYSAASTLPAVEMGSTAATFVNGRKASLRQIRLGRVTSGAVYYDNVSLSTYNDVEYTAYEGDEFTVTVDPDMGYELDRVTITDASGNVTEAEKVTDTQYTAKVPSDDAVISAEFIAERPADPPAGLQPATADMDLAFDDYVKATQTSALLLADGTVYLSGKHSRSTEKGSSNVGDLGSKPNTLRIAGESCYIAIMPAFDAELTVYTNRDTAATLGMGQKPGSCGLYLGELNTGVHTITVKAGTCVFISGVDANGSAMDIFSAGLSLRHAGGSAEVSAADEAPEADAAAEAPEAVEAPEADETVEAPEADEAAEEVPVIVAEEADELPTPEEAAENTVKAE